MHCIIHHLLDWHQFETWGFSQRHQNHVTKIVRAMSSNNTTLTGQTGHGKLEQWNQQWTAIPARMMCNDSWVKNWEQMTLIEKDMRQYAQYSPWDDRTGLIQYEVPCKGPVPCSGPRRSTSRFFRTFWGPLFYHTVVHYNGPVPYSGSRSYNGPRIMKRKTSDVHVWSFFSFLLRKVVRWSRERKRKQ